MHFRYPLNITSFLDSSSLSVKLAVGPPVLYLVSYSLIRLVSLSTCIHCIIVTVLESCGPRHRSDLGIAIQFGWALGYILLPAAAYWLRDFRHLQLLCTVPEFLLLSGWFFIPESPRWLLTHNRIKEGEVIITKAAKKNGLYTPQLEGQVKQLLDQFTAVSFKVSKFQSFLCLRLNSTLSQNSICSEI